MMILALSANILNSYSKPAGQAGVVSHLIYSKKGSKPERFEALPELDYSASTGTIETCFLSRPFLVNLTTTVCQSK